MFGPTRIKKIIIINPDSDGSAEKRFRDFIGRGIERRIKFFNKNTSCNGYFENSLEEIKDELEESYDIRIDDKLSQSLF